MDQKLIERFQKYENVLSLFTFFTKAIKWLCENVFNEKLEMIICQYDNFVEISNNEQMKKNCNYHKLLIKFNEIILMRRKMRRILKFISHR